MSNEPLRMLNDNSIMLCGNRLCCPVIEFVSEDVVRITDDHGGVVTLPVESARLIYPAMQKFASRLPNQSDQQLLWD